MTVSASRAKYVFELCTGEGGPGLHRCASSCRAGLLKPHCSRERLDGGPARRSNGSSKENASQDVQAKLTRSGDLGGIFRLNNRSGTIPLRSQVLRRAGKPRSSKNPSGTGCRRDSAALRSRIGIARPPLGRKKLSLRERGPKYPELAHY
jgi:hypothetical protein